VVLDLLVKEMMMVKETMMKMVLVVRVALVRKTMKTRENKINSVLRPLDLRIV
jgi:hypothetical protein